MAAGCGWSGPAAAGGSLCEGCHKSEGWPSGGAAEPIGCSAGPHCVEQEAQRTPLHPKGQGSKMKQKHLSEACNIFIIHTSVLQQCIYLLCLLVIPCLWAQLLHIYNWVSISLFKLSLCVGLSLFLLLRGMHGQAWLFYCNSLQFNF